MRFIFTLALASLFVNPMIGQVSPAYPALAQNAATSETASLAQEEESLLLERWKRDVLNGAQKERAAIQAENKELNRMHHRIKTELRQLDTELELWEQEVQLLGEENDHLIDAQSNLLVEIQHLQEENDLLLKEKSELELSEEELLAGNREAIQALDQYRHKLIQEHQANDREIRRLEELMESYEDQIFHREEALEACEFILDANEQILYPSPR